MGFSASARGGLALWALLAHGCMSGHLLDATRERELPVRYEEVAVDGDRLLLRYTALVTDDIGQPHGQRERRVAIALARLRQDPPLDAFPVEDLADDASFGGRRLELDGRIHADARGRHASLVLRDSSDGRYPAIYSSALARSHTPVWVYPLLPFTAAIDVVTNPLLLLLAPAVIVPGD